MFGKSAAVKSVPRAAEGPDGSPWDMSTLELFGQQGAQFAATLGELSHARYFGSIDGYPTRTPSTTVYGSMEGLGQYVHFEMELVGFKGDTLAWARLDHTEGPWFDDHRILIPTFKLIVSDLDGRIADSLLSVMQAQAASEKITAKVAFSVRIPEDWPTPKGGPSWRFAVPHIHIFELILAPEARRWESNIYGRPMFEGFTDWPQLRVAPAHVRGTRWPEGA